MRNLEAALRAEDELGVEVVQVRKDSAEYAALADPPPCPSVAIDGRLVVENGTADFERLQAELGAKG